MMHGKYLLVGQYRENSVSDVELGAMCIWDMGYMAGLLFWSWALKLATAWTLQLTATAPATANDYVSANRQDISMISPFLCCETRWRMVGMFFMNFPRLYNYFHPSFIFSTVSVSLTISICFASISKKLARCISSVRSPHASPTTCNSE
jgi:hypothetical protein